MLFNLLIYIGFVSAAIVRLGSPLSKAANLTNDAVQDTVQTLWFNQTLDHNIFNFTTFKQKYYVNSKYYKLGGPSFIFVDGEAPLSADESVLTGSILQLEIENSGILFGLEHRFYGDSQPFNE